jgi:hypothetical protein
VDLGDKGKVEGRVLVEAFEAPDAPTGSSPLERRAKPASGAR